MTLSAAFLVEGNANPAPHHVAYGSTVTLALTSTDGASSIVWEMMGCSEPTEPIPTITPGGSPYGSTASFTMPADSGDTLGRTFLVRCSVSNGIRAANGAYQIDRQYAVIGAENSQGELPVVPGEQNYRHGTHGWAPELNRLLNASGGGGGGDLSAPANPEDNGKVAVASSGDLAYSLVSDAHIASGAAIAHSKLATIATDRLLGRDSTGTGAVEPITVGGGLEFTGAGGIQVAVAGVTLAKLANGTGTSVVGRSASTAGQHSDIAALADGYVLRRSAGSLEFGLLDFQTSIGGTVPLNQLATLAGLSVLGRGPNSSGAMAAITGTAGQILRVNGTTLGFGAIDVGDPASVVGELQYANLPSAVGLSIIGRGASSSGVVGQIAGSANQVLRVTSDGTALSFGTITGAAIGSNEVTLVKLEQLAGYSLIGRAGTTTGNVAAITATADGQVMTRTVGGLSWGTTIGSSSTAFIVNGAGVTIQSAGVAVLHAVTLATGREILGIHGTVTTTQMPANTGDKVTFIAAATTAPAADGSPNATPSGGCIVYTNSAGEFVTVSTDTSTVLPAMKLGDGTRRVDIKAGGAVDGNIYLAVGGGYVHKFGSSVDFHSQTVGSDDTFHMQYGGTSFVTMKHATLGGTRQMSFFGASPVAQAADPGALSVSVGTADGTIAPVGASFNQTTLDNNFRDLADKYNALRTIVRNLGFAA